MKVRALFFDFDGLLVDTETAVLTAWQEIYRTHGYELPLDRWALGVGTRGGFDPLGYLEELERFGVDGAEGFDRTAVEAHRRTRELALSDRESLRPGVMEYLDAARERGLAIGVVSSSSSDWIDRHLVRLGCRDRFDIVVAAGEDPSRAKPRPTLYLEALSALEVSPEEGVALEDSMNGIQAAKAARIFCVAVPNPVTASSDLSAADLIVGSLADLPLETLIATVEAVRGHQ